MTGPPPAPSTRGLVSEILTVLGRARADMADLARRPDVALELALALARAGTRLLPVGEVRSCGSPRRLADLALRSRTGHADAQVPHGLSHGQRRMLLAESLEPRSADRTIVRAYHLRGPVRRDALAAALHDVVGHHAQLRTAYGFSERMEPLQRIADPADAALIEVTDEPEASGGPGGGPEVSCGPVAGDGPAAGDGVREDAERIAARWWESGFDLGAGPPFRARLVARGAGDHLLMVAVHHIAFDGWSERILREDLARAYRARCAGGPPDLEPTAPYRAFTEWEEHLLPAWQERELPFWAEQLRYLETESGVRARSGDAIPSAPGPGGAAEHQLHLDATAVSGLSARGLGAKALPLAVLMSVTGEVLASHQGAHRTLLTTIFSGRVESAFHRTIGCFVNPVAVPLDYPAGEDQPARLRNHSRAVMACLAHARTPVDVLTRELGPPARIAHRESALVMLHGASPAVEFAPSVAWEPLTLRQPGTTAALEVVAAPRGRGGWQLTARSGGHIGGQDTVRGLLEEVGARLRALSGGG